MANVTFTPNHQPQPACYPTDVNGMLDLISTGGGINGTIPDQSGGGVFVGSTPPTSALTNKVWMRTDAAGRPLGVFMFYNGNWRLVYTGSVGDVKFYSGNPAGVFDGTGRGIVGSMQDGWAICNGNNGTPNLQDRFIFGSAAFDGAGWYTGATGAKTYSGGEARHFINYANLPVLGAQLHVAAVGQTGGGGGLVGGPSDVMGVLPVVGSGNVPLTSTESLPLPPYIVLGLIEFIGYA